MSAFPSSSPPEENKPISQAISKIAKKPAPSGESAEAVYQEEERYTRTLAKQPSLLSPLSILSPLLAIFKRSSTEDIFTRSNITPEELKAAIARTDAHQTLIEKQDTHRFRKKFLGRLFWLVVGWLICVVYFVYKNATSPDMSDREKMIQVQNQIVSMALDNSNHVDSAMITIASPTFSEGYFHLSDSVLIAFITSTTVAVIGLFMTAARWLFKRPPNEPEN